jgi:hypothetical protein
MCAIAAKEESNQQQTTTFTNSIFNRRDVD